MLTTRPRLTTHRPSPTTVLFNVSTASPQDTLTSVAIHHALLLFRVTFGLVTCLVLLLIVFYVDGDNIGGIAGYVRSKPWSQVGPLAFASLFLVFRRFHTGAAGHTLVIIQG